MADEKPLSPSRAQRAAAIERVREQFAGAIAAEPASVVEEPSGQQAIATEPTPEIPAGWDAVAKNGRPFIRGAEGPIFRSGEETADEARARYARAREQTIADQAKTGERRKSGRPKGKGRKPDPKPEGRAPGDPPKATGTPKPTDADLVGMLGELLTMPAIPAKMVLDCDYCAQHFAREGPNAAQQLVTLSKTSPPLRRVLERWYAAWASITYGAILASYIGKPLLHHLAPTPMLEQLGPFVGVPPRPNRAEHAARHAANAAEQAAHAAAVQAQAAAAFANDRAARPAPHAEH